ncbi:hypothetical protein KIW84_063149 [Lathyrus oleraceus]|uniref:Uncharacterized protein n=1 Tax=Pisum sativum TaxID=3888 RepID=A0A9D4W8W9_PEA|nr:hypothetical protein KIW84_063149 [Pisum sativum]
MSQLQKNPAIKRMSPAEMELREKGLCYFCDEKFSFSHKCPNKQLMLLDIDPDIDLHPTQTEAQKEQDIDQTVEHHLLLNALNGTTGFGVIRFKGLPVEPTQKCNVLVGNGQNMKAEDPEMATLLHTYRVIFQIPKGLPPNKELDHGIVLKAGSQPVKVKPYRYPHSQKEQIEKMVQETLEEGIIQPSVSLLSSPIILVRKKNGTWRCCTYYKALNAITIKDSFPMPTVDELLDKLHGEKYFSKLQLKILPPLKFYVISYALGYDCNNYKVISLTKGIGRVHVHVHAFGTYSWRMIEDFPDPNFINYAPRTILNNYVNWLASGFIVFLDLKSESYQNVSLPADIRIPNSTICTFSGCLSSLLTGLVLGFLLFGQ